MPERSEVLRVYTFTLPKFVSGLVRKCAVVFSKKDQAKKSTTASKKKKKKQEKTPG